MNTAEKLVECLVQEGVEVIFGIPGFASSPRAMNRALLSWRTYMAD